MRLLPLRAAAAALFACGFHAERVALTALAVLLVRSDEATLDDLEIDEQGKLDLSGNAVDRYASAVRLLRPSPPRRAPLLFLLLLSG